jgi:hypothetical protein
MGLKTNYYCSFILTKPESIRGTGVVEISMELFKILSDLIERESEITHSIVKKYLHLLCPYHSVNAGRFKKSFTTLKAYINSFRGHIQCFVLSKCSKTHRVLPEIVTIQCDFHW